MFTPQYNETLLDMILLTIFHQRWKNVSGSESRPNLNTDLSWPHDLRGQTQGATGDPPVYSADGGLEKMNFTRPELCHET